MCNFTLPGIYFSLWVLQFLFPKLVQVNISVHCKTSLKYQWMWSKSKCKLFVSAWMEKNLVYVRSNTVRSKQKSSFTNHSSNGWNSNLENIYKYSQIFVITTNTIYILCVRSPQWGLTPCSINAYISLCLCITTEGRALKGRAKCLWKVEFELSRNGLDITWYIIPSHSMNN